MCFPPHRHRGGTMALGKEIAQGLLHLVFPGICPVCGAALAVGQPLPCATCRTTLTAAPRPACPRCGGSIGPFALVEGGCSVCRGTSYHFDQVLRLGPYEGLLRDVILRMKRPGGE